MNIDDIKIYLPTYLSDETQKQLFENLKNFPNPFDMFLHTSTNEILQGDGLIINIKNKNLKIMVISNSCDIDINNKRYFESFMLYAPLFSLNKYKDSLINSGLKKDNVDNHINDIKKQKITQIFYLPSSAYSNLTEDAFIFFDRITNISNNEIPRDNLKKIKIFSLNQSGFYIFLLKLSIHFTRMQERIDRGHN